jgi:hypothetical protein
MAVDRERQVIEFDETAPQTFGYSPGKKAARLKFRAACSDAGPSLNAFLSAPDFSVCVGRPTRKRRLALL